MLLALIAILLEAKYNTINTIPLKTIVNINDEKACFLVSEILPAIIDVTIPGRNAIMMFHIISPVEEIPRKFEIISYPGGIMRNGNNEKYLNVLKLKISNIMRFIPTYVAKLIPIDFSSLIFFSTLLDFLLYYYKIF